MGRYFRNIHCLIPAGASPTGGRRVLTPALLKTGSVDPPDLKMK